MLWEAVKHPQQVAFGSQIIPDATKSALIRIENIRRQIIWLAQLSECLTCRAGLYKSLRSYFWADDYADVQCVGVLVYENESVYLSLSCRSANRTPFGFLNSGRGVERIR
jgi:hypothetical protein